MSNALAKASHLKAEIRLAQAVSEFEADLSSEQKSTFRTLKSQTLSAAPSPSDVMRLTAEVDRRISRKFGGQCFGPRFTNFLQGVQQFAALGDTVAGGSQNLIACGVWSLVRMSLLSIVSLSTYVDKLSSLFMDIGRSAPRHQTMAVLYPRSTRLQTYLSEYYIAVVGLCRHLFNFGQKSTLRQFASTLNDLDLKTFRTELDGWANSIRDEMHLNESRESSGFRDLSRKMFKFASYQQKIASNLRVLDYCSAYDHQTTWKQIRKAGTASFFMQLAEYREWIVRSDPCTLIYTGKLGSGKSVLLANVVDDLNLSTNQKGCTVTYFFCRHDVPESLKARTILGSLARQLLCTVSDLSVLTEECKNARSTGDIEEVLELLELGFAPSHKAYFVLDGLDECNHEEQAMVLQALQKMQKTLNILVCASFRTEPSNFLQPITEHLAATRVISMPDDNPDIEAFIEADLDRCLCNKSLILGDPTLILEIHDALLRGSQGMFLWAALQIQSLCDMKTDRAIREVLADLPKDLSETFARILQKSGSSDRSLQVKTLQLVLAAYRPLTADELREALSVTPGEAIWDPSKLLNDVWSALACCGCLLIVDEEESTVRVVHHSFKQYVLNDSESSGANNVCFSAEEAQRTLADIVVTYLGYGVFETQLSTTKVHPLIVQSAPAKVVQTTIGSSSTTLNLALKLLKLRNQPDFDISKTLAEARGPPKLRLVNEFRFYSYAKSYWQQHIFYVSGKDAIMFDLSTKLIQSRKPEDSMMFMDYCMPCSWASRSGNSMIIELLLKARIIDVSAMQYKLTPLMWAVEDGYNDIVKVLLRSGKVDVNARDRHGWTPLLRAISKGDKGIVQILLTIGKADVNNMGGLGSGWTPILYAVSKGDKDIVEILLTIGKADVNATVKSGWTPILYAASEGNKDIVELLLATGKVDVDTRDLRAWMPLKLAAQKGHIEVAQVLESHLKHTLNWRELFSSITLVRS